MANASFETVRNIAGVAAVFAVLVSVSGERLSARGTGKCIDSLSINHFWVGIPPFHPAGVRAELLLALSSRGDDPLSTHRAEGRGRAWCSFIIGKVSTGQMISPTPGSHTAFGKAKGLRDAAIPVAFLAEGCDLAFLYIIHRNYLLHIFRQKKIRSPYSGLLKI
jgi:hypothetical protein